MSSFSSRRQLCGVNNHYIEGEPVYITDPKLVRFVQLANKEFRSTWPLCQACADSLKPTFEMKKQRMKELLKRKLPPDVSSDSSSSTSVGEVSTLTEPDVSRPRLNISSESTSSSEGAAETGLGGRLAAARDRARREFEKKRQAALEQYTKHLFGG